MVCHRLIRSFGVIIAVLVASTLVSAQSTNTSGPLPVHVVILSVDQSGPMLRPGPTSSLQRKIRELVYESPSTQLAHFPHLMIGGGFSTTIIMTNTGSTAASGILTLTHESGYALWVGLPRDSSRSRGLSVNELSQHPRFWFPVSLEPGETRRFTLTAPDPSYPIHRGWGQLDYRGGFIRSVTLLKQMTGNSLRTMTSIPSSEAVNSATIAVDDDVQEGKNTGLIITNTTEESIYIRMIAVNADGTLAEVFFPTDLNPLWPKRQVAEFVSEFSAKLANFKGSIILEAPIGKTFVATAVLEDQGVLTPLPVFPVKSPSIEIP